MYVFYVKLSLVGEKDVSNKQESPKSRTDLSMDIFEQLTLPLRDGHTITDGSASSTNLNDIPSGSDPASEINVICFKYFKNFLLRFVFLEIIS